MVIKIIERTINWKHWWSDMCSTNGIESGSHIESPPFFHNKPLDHVQNVECTHILHCIKNTVPIVYWFFIFSSVSDSIITTRRHFSFFYCALFRSSCSYRLSLRSFGFVTRYSFAMRNHHFHSRIDFIQSKISAPQAMLLNII